MIDADQTQQNYDDNEAYLRGFDDLLPEVAPIPKPAFVPTEDQAEALRLMKEFLRSPNEEMFCLRGYAGTGKTFCISELVKSGALAPDKVVFTAPTNKAVKVLKAYLADAGIPSACRTIYSLLGLSLQANGEVKELASREDSVDLSALDAIVVDEGSMVNTYLMKEIRRAIDENDLKVIFMGDPAQLPPVGEITSPIWGVSSQFTLTKVMRYDNAILDLATRLRDIVDHPAPAIKIETIEPVFVLKRPEFDAKILANLELLKSGEAKVIAWRNVTVDTYNRTIRKAIFGPEALTEKWLPDDKIVALASLKNLDDETFMTTDEGATIIKIVVGRHPKYSEYEIYNILVELENGTRQTIRVPTPTGQFDLNNKLESLATEAKAGKKYLWRTFWTLKEAFHEIRHAYAITTHRSQGSSYLKTFVDREDILLNRNRQEAFRSFYVACTRARKELNIA